MVKSPTVFSALITAFLMYSGMVDVCSRHAAVSVVPESDMKYIAGTIASSPVKSSTGTSYSMTVDLSHVAGTRISGPASGRVTLYVDASSVEALLPGRLYSAAESVTAEAGAESTFIYETGAYIQAEVSFTDRPSNAPVPCTVEYAQFYAKNVTFCGWRSTLDRIRAMARLLLKRILFAWGGAGGLLLALISGAREYTETDVSDSFRDAGLSHILALSGMHLSLFSSLTENTAGRALGRKMQPLLTLGASFVFVWFAGAGPSLVRALICMCITSVSGIAGIKISTLEKVCLSFLIHVCIFPEDAGSAAFMLSYGALLGLYAGDIIFKPLVSRFFPPSVASSVSASLGAQLCTAPVSIILFGECRPGGIIASVVVSPLASCFVTGGIVSLAVILAFPFLLHPVGVIMNYVYSLIRRFVMQFAAIPGISVAR